MQAAMMMMFTSRAFQRRYSAVFHVMSVLAVTVRNWEVLIAAQTPALPVEISWEKWMR